MSYSWTVEGTESSSESGSSKTGLNPVDLKLDDDGDVAIPVEFVYGIDAVTQGLRVRLRMFQGEWFLNLNEGVPYFQDILGHKYDEVRIRSAFRRRILSSPGVVELLELETSFDATVRLLEVAYRVRTPFGDSDLESLVIEV